MKTIRSNLRSARAGLCLTAAVIYVAGCGPKPEVQIPVTEQVVEGLDQAMKRISADPTAFLRQTLAETRKLRQFTTNFQRQERLGFFSELKPVENIFAEYRDNAFSVRFTWLDQDSEHKQCIYVEGRHDGNVVLMPRKGLFGLPPSERVFAPSLAVIFGKARNPITDFGPRRLMERTMDRIKNAKARGEVKIRLLPPARIGPATEQCFHIELRYPPGDSFRCKLQDLYISTRTNIPVATYLWLPGSPKRTQETLDAMYVYAELNSDVTLTDAHFLIQDDKSGGHPPATAGQSNAEHGPETPPARTALSEKQVDD